MSAANRLSHFRTAKLRLLQFEHSGYMPRSYSTALTDQELPARGQYIRTPRAIALRVPLNVERWHLRRDREHPRDLERESTASALEGIRDLHHVLLGHSLPVTIGDVPEMGRNESAAMLIGIASSLTAGAEDEDTSRCTRELLKPCFGRGVGERPECPTVARGFG